MGETPLGKCPTNIATLDPPLTNATYIVSFYRLHRYREAFEVWKEYRADINNTPHSSTTYELLLNAFQTPQTVEALRQDMLRLGVVMNDGCGLAYVRLLLKNDKTSEVMDFVKTDLVLRVWLLLI